MFKFDSAQNLVLGLVAGLVFGFLLQRGAVTRYRVILGQFLWTNHTMLRVMLTAIVVGAIGIYAMHQLWAVKLHIKDTALLGNVVGGAIFGIGMVVLGYCPGTGVGFRHGCSSPPRPSSPPLSSGFCTDATSSPARSSAPRGCGAAPDHQGAFVAVGRATLPRLRC